MTSAMWIVLALIGCKQEKASMEQLLDPKACAECHPQHYQEWAGSMHAYAAEDPVFLAMNERGQRETNGEMGDFCVSCHAPLAVQEGLTTDGLNLDEVPDAYKGVTCYFCHQITAVEGKSNNPLKIAWDKVMRGGIPDPLENTFHDSSYSPLHDRYDLRSSDACGSCHDIVAPLGAHIERTYLEWEESIYGTPGDSQLSCSNCHMRSRNGVVADYPGVPFRDGGVHDHSMPGVDLALTEWPDRERQKELVQRELNKALLSAICVYSGNSVVMWLDNIGAGHSFPSGAAADRRVWVEAHAYDGDELAWSTGVVPEGTPAVDVQKEDPEFWLLRDTLLDTDGKETHMFWEAASYRTNLVPAPYFDAAGNQMDGEITRQWDLEFTPSRITAVVRIRAVGLDVLDDLIESGDLDPAIRDEIVTMDLQTTQIEWRPELADSDGCVGL